MSDDDETFTTIPIEEMDQNFLSLAQIRTTLEFGADDGADELADELEWLTRNLSRMRPDARDAVRNLAAEYTNTALLGSLRAGEFSDAAKLVQSFAEFAAAGGWPTGEPQSTLAANVLAAAMMSGDEGIGAVATGPLLPGEITDGTLAFNLASFWAVAGEEAKMNEVVRTAIQLGREPSGFLNDADFAPYLESPDFLDALEG